MNMEEMEIDLKQLFIDILKQWRKILLAMVVLGVIGAIIGGVKQAQVKPTAYTEDDIKAIEEKTQVVKRNKEKYEQMSKYNLESPLMELDPYDVSWETLEFVVTSKNKNEELPKYELESLANQYVSQINSQKAFQDIASITGIDVAYVRDLLVTEITDDDETSSQIALKDFAYRISLTIYGNNQDICGKIAEYYENNLLSPKSNIVSTLGEHEIVIANKAYEKGFNQELFDTQKNNISLLSTAKETYEKQSGSLSDAEKAYLDTEELTSSAEASTKDMIKGAIKYGLIGAIAGIFIVCAIICCVALFSGKLQSASVLEDMSGIKTYICSSENENKKGLDKVISKLQGKSYNIEEAIAMLKAEIDILANKEAVKTVFVTSSDVNDSDIKATLDEIEKIAFEKVKITMAKGSILDDPQAMTNMSESDRMIIVEKKGISRINDISKIINISKEYGTKIISLIAIN